MSLKAAPDADVRIETTPETWAALLASPKDERCRFLDAMRVSGEKLHVDEFIGLNWIEKRL